MKNPKLQIPPRTESLKDILKMLLYKMSHPTLTPSLVHVPDKSNWERYTGSRVRSPRWDEEGFVRTVQEDLMRNFGASEEGAFHIQETKDQ